MDLASEYDDQPDEQKALLIKFNRDIEEYERRPTVMQFMKRAKELYRRYAADINRDYGNAQKYPLLWSNMQTLQPATYARPPKVVAQPRQRERNAVARVASMLLERTAQFNIDNQDFDNHAKMCRDDFLILGRGTSWVRYDAKFGMVPMFGGSNNEGQSTSQTDMVSSSPNVGEQQEGGVPQEVETLLNEEVIFDYVYYRDFGYSYARTWADVERVWKKAYLTKAEFKKRFPKYKDGNFSELEGNAYDGVPDDMVSDEERKADRNKICVYELWDKPTKKVYWFNQSLEENNFLDMQDDILELDGFLPCPRPLFATLTPDNCLVPVAEFIQYQDQANNIDLITTRLCELTSALKISGIYDANYEEIGDIITSDKLIPIRNYSGLAGEGGLAGAIEFMPLADIVNTIQHLIALRQEELGQVTQISGMSDIIRGFSDPGETATAQQIKGQYATLRIKEKQDEMQRFLRDEIRIACEIIKKKFSDQTILKAAGVSNMSEADKQAVGAALALLRNSQMSDYEIDIETDSTLALDESSEKEDRIELLNAATGFMGQMMQLSQQAPALSPALYEMFLFAVRGFRVGKGLESTLEEAIQALRQEQEVQSQQEPPTDLAVEIAQAKLQLEQQVAEAKIELEREKNQAKMQLDQEKLFSEQKFQMMKLQHEAQLERTKLQSQMEMQQMKLTMEQQLKDIPAGTDQLIATIRQIMETKENERGEEPEVLPALSSRPTMNINVSLANPNRTVTLSAPNADGSKTGFITDEVVT